MKNQYTTPETFVVEATTRAGYMEEGVFVISYKRINKESVGGKGFGFDDDEDEDEEQDGSHNLWDD